MKLIRDRVQITVSDDLNGKLSGERDVRILYVYEGKAILRLDGTEVALKRDDFYVTGSGDTAEYRMEQGIGEERVGVYLRNIFSNAMSQEPAAEQKKEIRF